jgi:SSS family solute:Na+ symporter
VFATFIVEELPTPALGIVLGAVFSAAMSTLSSSLNSSATALTNDVWFPLFRPGAGERAKLRAVRAWTIVFGVLQVTVGIAGQSMSQTVVDSVLAISGFVTGIVLGVFLLGVLTRRVGENAALCGMIAGMATVSFVAFATPIAWPWFALIGSSTTFVTGVAASLLIPSTRQAS